MKSSRIKSCATIASAILIAACGGGSGGTSASGFGGGGGSGFGSGGGGGFGQTNPPGSPTSPTGTAEGLYYGVTDTGRSLTGIVLNDGTYFVLYSVVNNPAYIGGAIQGTGTSSNGTFSSTNTKDINLEGAGLSDASLSASYVQKKSLNGSLTSNANQSVTFTSAYDADYELTPALATLAGTYVGATGSPAGVENLTLTITTGGAISGTGANGCSLTGAVTPRTSGNAYTTTITFGGAPCTLPNITVTGDIYFDDTDRIAYAVALNEARTHGVIYAGAKL